MTLAARAAVIVLALRSPKGLESAGKVGALVAWLGTARGGFDRVGASASAGGRGDLYL
jgi:hypothetical protein